MPHMEIGLIRKKWKVFGVKVQMMNGWLELFEM